MTETGRNKTVQVFSQSEIGSTTDPAPKDIHLSENTTLSRDIYLLTVYKRMSLLYLNSPPCFLCSVHSCGAVQDVHCHGPVTSQANSK